MKFTILTAAAALALAAGTFSAQAACGIPLHAQPVKVKLPPLNTPKHPSGVTIVGTWQTEASIQHQVVFRTLIQWHNDGTEFDNADLPPINGNTCEGSWVSTGARTVHRYHIGWTFDASSNPNGSFVLTEDNRLASDGNSYKGKFVQKFYDQDGNLVNKIAGFVKGTRVTAD